MATLIDELRAQHAHGPQTYVGQLSARAADEIERLQKQAQSTPRCATCNGDGVVWRSWGYIPCDACGGRGH